MVSVEAKREGGGSGSTSRSTAWMKRADLLRDKSSTFPSAKSLQLSGTSRSVALNVSFVEEKRQATTRRGNETMNETQETFREGSSVLDDGRRGIIKVGGILRNQLAVLLEGLLIVGVRRKRRGGKRREEEGRGDLETAVKVVFETQVDESEIDGALDGVKVGWKVREIHGVREDHGVWELRDRFHPFHQPFLL